MSAHAQLIELLQPRPRGQRGEIAEHEKWWADRQKALEQAGYTVCLDLATSRAGNSGNSLGLEPTNLTLTLKTANH